MPCPGDATVTDNRCQAGQRQTPAMARNKPLIAVVDDDQSVVKSLARALRVAGYEVAPFGSAQAFLGAASTLLPQCLVLDVRMPEMTGFELQDRLAAQDFCAPVIFVTAHDTPQTRARARQAGSFGLFLKPFDPQALLRAIAEAVR